jgi:hypothetical protein
MKPSLRDELEEFSKDLDQLTHKEAPYGVGHSLMIKRLVA